MRAGRSWAAAGAGLVLISSKSFVDYTSSGLETPLGYALLAANEAEKAADIEVMEFRAIGRFGRVYLGGNDQAIRIAAEAAVDALRQLEGRQSG